RKLEAAEAGPLDPWIVPYPLLVGRATSQAASAYRQQRRQKQLSHRESLISKSRSCSVAVLDHNAIFVAAQGVPHVQANVVAQVGGGAAGHRHVEDARVFAAKTFPPPIGFRGVVVIALPGVVGAPVGVDLAAAPRPRRGTCQGVALAEIHPSGGVLAEQD